MVVTHLFAWIYNMLKTDKNQQLKKYLDEQIAHFHTQQSNKPTFDNIEAKL